MSVQRLRGLWLGLSALLTLQGLSWTLLGSFEPTGWYDGQLAASQLGTAFLPPDAARIFTFMLIPFGATDAAYFALVGLIVYHAFSERWACRAVASSFLLWFSIDTVGCACCGAWFNVLTVNVPCLSLVGPALFAWWHAVAASPRARENA